jgi:hypothetical protein
MRHILYYTKTYPQLLLHPLRLVIEFPAGPVYCIGSDGVVVEGVGWARHSDVLNQSREVFPAQQAEDAIGGDNDPQLNPQPSKTCPSDK